MYEAKTINPLIETTKVLVEGNMLKKIMWPLLLSLSFCSFLPAMDFSGFTKLEVSSLSCSIEGHATITKMDYAPKSGEMHFYEGDKPLLQHWDAFYFFKDKNTERIWVVYHDGGSPDLEGADAFIDSDMSGKILFGDMEGVKLRQCSMIYMF